MAASYQGKIMARSPFYITATGSTYITSATLQVFIWQGAFASQPATAQYTISKNALTATSTNIIFEIAPLVRDYFNHNRDAYADTLSTFADCVFVEIILSVVQTVGTVADVNYYYHAFDGYGNFSDAVNPQGTDVIVNTINVLSGQDILHPVYAHSDGIDQVKYYSSAGALQTTVSLATPVASTNAYDKTQYLTRTSASNTYSFTLLYSTVVQETVIVNYIDPCKYTAVAIKFYDKNGMLQKIWMYAKSSESLSTNKNTYNKITGSVSGGAYVYSTEKHQKQPYNITANKSIVLNSGWVLEAQNTIWEQLFLSELVWVNDKPANITSQSLEYKTQLNDRLINYTFNFDYAYSEINNVY